MFLPKPVARKLGLKPIPDPDEERAEKTLIHACMQLLSEYQGKGLGTMLMERLIEWAKDNEWERIEANHIPEGTDSEHWRWGWAVPKWERMGFRIARIHPSTSVVLDLDSYDSIRSETN
jgi:GNAT superfamily N-acetyltransferase